MKLLFVLALFISISTVINAQVIPDSMRVDWSHAGYEGTIPDPITVADITGYGAIAGDGNDDFSSVMAAINSLSGNAGVVYFPPGEYDITSTLSLTDSVILRGAGSDSTTLRFDLGNTASDCIRIWKGQSASFVNILSGLNKGSNIIEVSDASGFSIGDYAEIKETNGAWDTQPVFWATDCVGQIVTITDIVGDSLFLDDELRIDFNAALNPQIRKFTPITNVGLECFHLVRADTISTGVAYNISYLGAAKCWVRGVESDYSIGSHIIADLSTHLEISGCYFHHSYYYDGVSTHGYGVTLIQHTSNCLVEDNFFRHLRHAMMVKQGANGNVFSYNYSIEPTRTEFPTNASGDISCHGHYPFANLFEGNVAQNLMIDQAWGPSGPYNTFFRNRLDLYGIVMSSGTVNTNQQNFVGNEITNTGAFLGFYILTGSNHFLWGNNLQGVIDPSGTDSLPDISYYLSSTPSFWNIGFSFPSIGVPNIISSGSIPAKERYTIGGVLTVCEPAIPTSDETLTDHSFLVYPNPFSEEFILLLPAISTIAFSYEVFDLMGRKMDGSDRQYLSANQNIVIHSGEWPPGIYLLRLQIGGEQKSIRVEKF